MNVNKGKLFTYNSNALTLMNFCRLLNVRVPKIFDQFKDQDKNISPFHRGLNDLIEEQIAKQ